MAWPPMRKRYRVVIDMDVEVPELTLERVLRTRAEREALWDEMPRPVPIAPPTTSAIARQQLLLQQLLSNAGSLTRYLRVGVMQELTIGGIPAEYEANLDDDH